MLKPSGSPDSAATTRPRSEGCCAAENCANVNETHQSMADTRGESRTLTGLPLGILIPDHAQTRHSPERTIGRQLRAPLRDRKSTRLNSSHRTSSYAVFCLKKKKKKIVK